MRTNTKTYRYVLAAALIVIAAVLSNAETLVLSNKFITDNKDRATITTKLHVDVHPNKAHPISKGGDDGDIHMAGRDTVIKLPLVAEIMNAGGKIQNQTDAQTVKKAVTFLGQTDPDTLVNVTGAWRIWFEHLGKEDQIQGKTVPAPTTSNPQHLFEIHPITKFSDIDVSGSLVEIPGYTAYTASKAFEFYENNPATIQATKTAISITAGEGKFNYTEFVIELTAKPKKMDDGLVVLARVYDSSDSEEQVTATPKRMIFISGTPPAEAVKNMSKGDKLHVLGIPRVSLFEVFQIVTKNGTKPASVNLPYEMIIVAVLPEPE